jgi:hypothetical protein
MVLQSIHVWQGSRCRPAAIHSIHRRSAASLAKAFYYRLSLLVPTQVISANGTKTSCTTDAIAYLWWEVGQHLAAVPQSRFSTKLLLLWLPILPRFLNHNTCNLNHNRLRSKP